MEKDVRTFNEQFVSVQDACVTLGCGRTKIYTHYIANGLLAVKKKIGNRSYFLRSDVEKLRDEEQLAPITSASESRTVLISPASKSEEQQSLSDYITALKNRVHELEQHLQESNEQLNHYRQKSLQSVSLLEFQEKLRQKDGELARTNELMQYAEQRSRHLETQNRELNEVKESTLSQLQDVEGKFSQSLQVAVAFKNLAKEEEEKRLRLEEQFTRLRHLHEQLDHCGFFAFGIKRRLRQQIQSVLATIRRLHTSNRQS